jgi:hypothetical protein
MLSDAIGCIGFSWVSLHNTIPTARIYYFTVLQESVTQCKVPDEVHLPSKMQTRLQSRLTSLALRRILTEVGRSLLLLLGVHSRMVNVRPGMFQDKYTE